MSSFAQCKWNILRSFVKNKSLSTNEKRRHAFGLFTSKTSSCQSVVDDNDYELLEYISTFWPEWKLVIRQRIRAANWGDAIGFDNTGNICVWPSEEILAYLCIKDKEKFRGKTVCELGAGMTGLAGFMLSMACDVKEMLLTDGNIDAVTNLAVINNMNKSAFGQTIVNTRLLKWNEAQSHSDLNHFDFVICADCLLFEESHASLLNVMYNITTDKGVVIIVSPCRGSVLEKFAGQAQAKFNVEEIENYDEHIWQHYVQEKEHAWFSEAVVNYPILLKLSKSNEIPK